MQHDDAYYGNDKLFTLKDARDPVRMRNALAAELPPGTVPGELTKIEIETLRRRKQRCVLRYRVHSEGEAGAHSQNWIGKIFKADAGAPVTDLMRLLWDAGFQRGAEDGVSIPEVVAYLPRLSLLLQEEIGGIPVKDHLMTDQAEPALRAMARALVKLHRSPVRVGPTYRIHDHLRRCHPRPNVLRERCPELRPAVDEILREAKRLEDAYAGFAPALVHGDFHMGQVHVGDGRTWLIDFDACCVADPAADVGNVLVFLKGKARKIPSAPLLADAFQDEYFRAMPSEIGRRVPLYEAITHLRRACKRLRIEEDGWEKKARRFLDDSLESLAVARG